MVTQKCEDDIFDFFGGDYDRFGFPEGITRVTSLRGGEVYLIKGSEKTAIYDCGMCYCGPYTVENIREVLESMGRETIDYIFLSHSHYDHMGALPYIKRAFPQAVVVGSEKCSKILSRPNARTQIKRLGEVAREHYKQSDEIEILMDPLEVDMVVYDGDVISLGEETVKVLATPGHTDCSLTYAVEPLGMLFTCESTGLIESESYVNTPILKSFDDAMYSLDKCRNYGANYICLPHFGLLPQSWNERYWDMFEDGCNEVVDFARQMEADGLDLDGMIKGYYNRYWNPKFSIEQPIEAYLINTEATIKAALRATYR